MGPLTATRFLGQSQKNVSAVSALAAVVFFAYLFQQRLGRVKLHLERLRPRMRENLRIVDGDFIGNRRGIDVLQAFDGVQRIAVPAVACRQRPFPQTDGGEQQHQRQNKRPLQFVYENHLSNQSELTRDYSRRQALRQMKQAAPRYRERPFHESFTREW